MPHAPSLLATIAISLTLAYACGVGARLLRLPPLLGYLAAGMVAGPFTPGFVADQRVSAELAEIGVALLLFGVGIHFSLADLLAVWRVAVPGALLQIAISTAIGFGVGGLFGWEPAAALILGLALAIASTAVATRALDDRGSLQGLAGRIALGWLVMQDLVVVVALVLLPSLAASEAISSGELARTIGLTLLQVGAFVAVVLVVGRRVIPWALEWTARDGSRELFRLAVIVVALGVAYGAASLGGVSLALGAFFAGVVIAESDLSHQAAAETVPIQQVFTVLFFVSIGMLFDPMVLIEHPGHVAAATLTILLGTGGVTALILLAMRTPPRVAMLVGGALGQIGEFSFILTGLAAASGLLPPEGRDLVLAAALLAIVANPFVVGAAVRLGTRLDRSAGFRRWRDGKKEARVRAAVPKLVEHAIIIGHGRVGSVVAASLARKSIPYIVVEQNLAMARDLRQEGVPVVYGDAGWPEVLDAARPDTARVLIIAIPERGNVRRIVDAAREANPNLRIIVRTHSDAEARWLQSQSIERVVMSEQRTAMEIAEHALQELAGEAPPPRRG